MASKNFIENVVFILFLLLTVRVVRATAGFSSHLKSTLAGFNYSIGVGFS